ncbi:hypothetical protein ACI3KS_12715 [Microbacterium sp. ZW T5_45]|uniref:hypothetical protein n=1 Tax=Microbacterium sp. ZW T5_45 TaxID=3378080 RepID=UPI003852B352
MNRWVSWLAGAALVAAAGGVVAVTPSTDTRNGPFLVHGTVSDTVASRELVVTVDSASFADRVTVSDDDWQAEGNWLVVELSAAARQTEVEASMRLATLVVDGREFIASERPSTSLIGTELRVGIDTHGMLAFQLPTDLEPSDAELRLAGPHSTPRLDDVIVVHLDLESAARERTIDILEPTIGESS